jgi:ubiquinone/menaquinone biosynthesis C-methylase UbiE
MRFDDPATARTYAGRQVDATWEQWCRRVLDPAGKDVVDIGCGGGIYSRGFRRCGAKTVTGVDASLQYVRESQKDHPGLRFIHAPCEDTGLPDTSVDLVFERALIHHLDRAQQVANAHEMHRLLRAGGTAVVQDRTIEDVRTPSDDHWIRRELLTMFPRLLEIERARRPDRAAYRRILRNAGFAAVEIQSVIEVRRIYAGWNDLEQEILSRKGKSILFELADDELAAYCRRLAHLAGNHELIERDPWTVWIASKQPRYVEL